MSLLLTVVRYEGEVYGMPGERSTTLPDGAELLGWEYSREPLESVNLPSIWVSFVRPASGWYAMPATVPPVLDTPPSQEQGQ